MAVKHQFWVFGFFLLGISAGLRCGAQAAGTPSPQLTPSHADPQQVIAQMEATQTANPARSQPYVLVRDYRFFQGERPNDAAKSEVTAEVSFQPPNQKSFEILETRGSGRGTSVVKHILENESELSKDVSRNEYSRRNYDFTLLGESSLDGRRCYVLSLAPRRDDHALLRGRLYLDSESYRILRVEGEPARTPSWWLRSSYIVLRFAEVEGLWLPVATEGTGEVRMFGHFLLSSQKVSVRVGAEAAAARIPVRGHAARVPTTVGTALVPPR